MTQGTCSIDGCDREAKAKGWCQPHYMRWFRNGDPEVGLRFNQKPPDDRICVIEDCEKTVKARGWCDVHYYRWRVNGDPMIVQDPHPGGEDHWNWSGVDASYEAAHQRLKKVRGVARAHGCEFCDRQARDWAYDYEDPDYLIDIVEDRFVHYSLNFDHYMPLCASCHKKFDLAARWCLEGDG